MGVRCRALQLAALAALAALATAGKFDKFTTCEACVEAGWGWHPTKNKCGGFPNKECAGAAPKPAAAVALPNDGKPVVLAGTEAFDAFVKGTDIVLVEFFAPWCGHCKKLDKPYAEAAALLKDELPNVRLAQVDTTDESNTDIKIKYQVTGFPTCFVFRQGEKLYKTLDEPAQRTGPLIASLMRHEASQPPPPPPGAPIFLKFDIQGSSKLMEHKIKSQIALFYHGKDAALTAKLLKEFEATANEYAGKIIALHIDVDDDTNTPVLGRFAVDKSKVPCMRVAQIYPEGMSGMSIYWPDPSGGHTYTDTTAHSTAQMSAFVADHLAEPRKTKPYLRSDRRPSYIQGLGPHPDVVDLMGSSYDDYVMDPKKHVFSFFFMQTCPHCKDFTPLYQNTATKIKALNAKRPAGEPEISLVRMNTVRNDVGHEKIYTGSYPTFYWLPGDSPTTNDENSKANPLHVNTLEDFTQDEEGMMKFLKARTWLGAMKDEL